MCSAKYNDDFCKFKQKILNQEQKFMKTICARIGTKHNNQGAVLWKRDKRGERNDKRR